MLIELGVIGAALAAAASIGAYTVRTGISPMPTLPAARRALLAALPPDVDGTVHELGAGWGALALPLARRLPAARVVAWELSPLPWAVLALRARLSGRRNVVVRRADFLRGDLSDAALVVCYLHPGAMERLAVKLAEELPAGACVVSHTFALPGWRPQVVLRAADLHRSPIYVYRWPQAGVPAGRGRR